MKAQECDATKLNKVIKLGTKYLFKLNALNMKTNTFFIAAIFTACCMFSSCKKSGGSLGTHWSYTFNGKKYEGNDGTFQTIYNSNASGIIGYSINRPDLFGNTLVFVAPDCGYITDAGNILIDCSFVDPYANASDSSLVYLYQSGSFYPATSNCRNETGTDILTGNTITVKKCDMNMSFSITFINGKGDKIEITDGSYTGTINFY